MSVTPRLLYDIFREVLREELRIYHDYEHVHVTELVQCLRKSWFSRKFGDVEKLSHLSDTKCVILALGILAHRELARRLEPLGFSCEVDLEYRVRDGLILCGRPDAVGENCVLEFKTVSSIPPNPYEHHYLQINTYLYMAGKQYGYLIYISKRDGVIKVFDVYRSEEYWRYVLTRAEKYQRYLVEDVCPPAEVHYLCQYCEWWLLCHRLPREEVPRSAVEEVRRSVAGR